jgi:hypothetical protein
MPDVPLPTIPEKFSLTPEFRLLAACSWIAPPALEQGQAERIAALCREGIDWSAFLVLVRRHGVPALAYAALGRHAGEALPQVVRETLQKYNSTARLQALFQAAELVRLIKLFAGQGIDVIPLKGVFLSHLLYADTGMRASCDLDILVKAEQVDLAERILAAEGYYCDCQGDELSLRQKQHVRTHIHHFDFAHSKSGLHVELHWNVGPWLPGQLQALLGHTARQEWQGISVDCLDDDATLLLLCDHGSRHEWISLKWLGDVAHLLSSDRPTGWKPLLALAQEVDLLRTLAHSALLVHWVYGISLPEELCQLIQREHQSAALSTRACATLLMTSDEVASAGRRAHRMRVAWHTKQLRPSLPVSLLLKSVLVPVEDFQVLRLPAALFWLYYPLRPVLWFWRNYIKSPKKNEEW